jgi:hypothetical protein
MWKSLGDCNEQWSSSREGGRHLYTSNMCEVQGFDWGYNSHIRGNGLGLVYNTKIFPGIRQSGNEGGQNGPIYVDNPDQGVIVAINRRYQGDSRMYNMTWR